MTASYRHLSELPCGLVSSDIEEKRLLEYLLCLQWCYNCLSLVLSESYGEACRDRVVFQNMREL